MTREELKQYDGKDGKPAYIAYKGAVYDVTQSKLWKNGAHVRRHFAGEDLTDALAAAPHAEEVFTRFPQVGTLETEKFQRDFTEKMQDLYALLHPHPMAIHLPMGLYLFAPILYLLFLWTGLASFESAAFYCIVGATIFMLPSMATGFLSWWINYACGMNTHFKYKIIFSILLTLLGAVESYIRWGNPGLVNSGTGSATFYIAMLFINVPILGVIGFHGGKLTWN